MPSPSAAGTGVDGAQNRGNLLGGIPFAGRLDRMTSGRAQRRDELRAQLAGV